MTRPLHPPGPKPGYMQTEVGVIPEELGITTSGGKLEWDRGNRR